MHRAIAFALAAAAVLAVRISDVGASFALQRQPPFSASELNGGIVVLAKVNCGFDEDGNFSCKHMKKKRHSEDNEQNQDTPASSSSDKPTNEGTPPQGGSAQDAPAPKPSTGQCFTVETTETGKISCGGDFSARSCGAVENGKITCCCVR